MMCANAALAFPNTVPTVQGGTLFISSTGLWSVDEIIVSPLLRFLQTEPSNAMCEWKGWWWWRKVAVVVANAAAGGG